MITADFDKVFAYLQEKTSAVLQGKREEYADDYDVLQNFKRAAALKNESPAQALAGMMAKHTVSVYEMVDHPPGTFTGAQWDEKIIDHMNYLILLRAIVEEDNNTIDNLNALGGQ